MAHRFERSPTPPLPGVMQAVDEDAEVDKAVEGIVAADPSLGAVFTSLQGVLRGDGDGAATARMAIYAAQQQHRAPKREAVDYQHIQ